MTSRIEERLKAELEEELGPILTEEAISEIAQKEEERKVKQDLALKRSRMKIMRVKERAREIQRIRQDLLKDKNIGKSYNPNTKNSRDKKQSKFKKMNIEY
ncbi:MAG: hypothetical protein Q7J67_00370 [bacterium]|nr:hypothetical protein [bacterium]